MKETPANVEVRKMSQGDWYWIQNAVIQAFVPRTGAIGIAVYNFLASMADRSQSCFPSQQYMAEKLGYSRATIHRALKRLQESGLIRKEMRSRYHCTYLLLDVRCSRNETQMSQARNSDVSETGTNKTKSTRLNNNDVVSASQRKHALKRRLLTREELLAQDISETLNDQGNLRKYLFFARKFPEPILREFLSQVKQTPAEKIRKSRAALFAYLVRRYAEQTA